MVTHLTVLSESFLTNTNSNMTGFRCFSKMFVLLGVGQKQPQHYKGWKGTVHWNNVASCSIIVLSFGTMWRYCFLHWKDVTLSCIKDTVWQMCHALGIWDVERGIIVKNDDIILYVLKRCDIFILIVKKWH